MKNWVQSGKTVDWVADGNVTSGDFILRGALFGIATISGVSGDVVPLRTGGVVDYAKLNTEAWTFGAAVYWDSANSRFTTVSSGNTKAGVAVLATSNPSPVGRIRLNATF